VSACALPVARGLLITFEGGEGSGKSTQVAHLARRLRTEGWEVVTAREPGGTELGERVRAITRDPAAPLAELFLFEAARAQLVTELVRPALAASAIVILDRYADSTLAYQGYGRGLDLGMLRQVNAIATGGLTPDLTFLLDLDVDEGLQRKLGEIGHDAIGREHRAFHERVRAGYLTLAAAEPERWLVLDAALPPDVLAERVWAAVQQRLAARHLK
jgi:dTMP kinase